jgi:hypothetical protein
VSRRCGPELLLAAGEYSLCGKKVAPFEGTLIVMASGSTWILSFHDPRASMIMNARFVRAPDVISTKTVCLRVSQEVLGLPS